MPVSIFYFVSKDQSPNHLFNLEQLESMFIYMYCTEINKRVEEYWPRLAKAISESV